MRPFSSVSLTGVKQRGRKEDTSHCWYKRINSFTILENSLVVAKKLYAPYTVTMFACCHKAWHFKNVLLSTQEYLNFKKFTQK